MSNQVQLKTDNSRNGLLANNMILIGDTPVKFDKNFMAQYMGVPNISDQNMAKILTKAYAEGLNPLTDFYVVAFNGKCDLMEKVENKLKRAQQNEDYKGLKQGVFVLNRKDELEKRDNEIVLKGEELVGAWCSIETHTRGTIEKSVNREEYDKKRSTWKDMPITMLVKVARGQALDLAFPNLFNGMYTQEEVQYNEKATVYDKEEVSEAEVVEAEEIQADIIETKPDISEMFNDTTVGEENAGIEQTSANPFI